MPDRIARQGARVVIIAALWMTSPAASDAQINVTRNLRPAPLDDSTGANQFLPHTHFFGELQGGFGSTEGEQAWNIKVGGMMELYRWGRRSALVGLVAHELTANPHNNINFNPRGAIWEESLIFLRRQQTFGWHVGAFHRCRHELDNAEPPNPRAAPSEYVPTRRLLILSGVQGGIASHDIAIGRRGLLRGFFRVEGYAFASDRRTPRNSDSPHWNDAIGATMFGARVRVDVDAPVTLYAGGWGSVMVFSRDRSRARGIHPEFNGRVELGVRRDGMRGGLDAYAAIEHFFDDVSRPVPRPSSVVYLGVRMGSTALM